MSFVDAHDFPVDLVLRVLGVPASTYYDWRARQAAPGRRQLEHAELLEMIVKIRTSHEFAATYGSPRVWLALRRQGMRCGRKRVERIMRENGLQGAFLRKGWKGGSTKQNPRHVAAPDLVERDFTATEPNRLWVADLTGLPVRACPGDRPPVQREHVVRIARRPTANLPPSGRQPQWSC
jgi:putative transposase